MVLVDTTVWIDQLRRRDTPAVRRLRELLALGLASVAPVVVQEVLQGASSPAGLETLRVHFMALPMLTAGAQTHAEAGALYARARWRGVMPRSPHDCLIAQLAIENERPLLHDDRDFEALREVDARLALLRD